MTAPPPPESKPQPFLSCSPPRIWRIRGSCPLHDKLQSRASPVARSSTIYGYPHQSSILEYCTSRQRCTRGVVGRCWGRPPRHSRQHRLGSICADAVPWRWLASRGWDKGGGGGMPHLNLRFHPVGIACQTAFETLQRSTGRLPAARYERRQDEKEREGQKKMADENGPRFIICWIWVSTLI